MVNSYQEPSTSKRRVVILALIIIIAIVVAIIYLNRPNPQGQFQPDYITGEPMGSVSSEPLEITFSELDSDPAAFQSKLVRVSGNYTRLNPIVCLPHKGPRPRWGLIADGFQMDIVGIEEIIELAPEGAPLVVEGIWRLYDGPLGCGKEPDRASLWYLEARRIIEPNPLQFNGVPITGNPGDPNTPPITETVSITTTIAPTTSVGTVDPTATPTLVGTPSTTSTTATPTTVGTETTTPISTPTADINSVTATPRPGENSTATSTPIGGSNNNTTATPTSTPTISGSVTAEPTEEALPTSPSGTVIAPTLEPTPTPGSYEGPTPTPGSYP